MGSFRPRGRPRLLPVLDSDEAFEGILSATEHGERVTALEILGEGRTSAKVLELVEDAGGWSDEATRQVPKVPVDCQAGCAYCCSLQVEVTVPEALACFDYARTHTTGAALERVERQIQETGQRVASLSAPERLVTNVPCALLVDGHCSVYPVRPLLCRGWNSVDVATCKQAFDEPERKIETRFDEARREVPNAVQRGLSTGLSEHGLDGRRVNLAVALKILVDDPHALDRWLAGEDAFKPARLEVGGDLP